MIYGTFISVTELTHSGIHPAEDPEWPSVCSAHYVYALSGKITE